MLELEQVIAYIQEALQGQKIVPFKDKAMKLANEVEELLQKEYPKEVLSIVRPNEPAKVKEYRTSVYEPIIKADFAKVVTVLQKIRLAEGFKITTPVEQTELGDYLSKDFPITYSFSNWAFNYLLSKKLIDSNAVCMVYPSNFDKAEEEPRPYPYIFPVKHVICYNDDLVACVDKATNEGQYISALTKESFYYIFLPQQGEATVLEIMHGIGEVPAFKLAGNIYKTWENEVLYNSFISPCLPYWRKALRTEDDENASIIGHIYPDKWQYTNRACKGCKTKGSLQDGSTCTTCNGSGYVHMSSPFGVHTIHPEKTSITEQAPVVTPPAGYITKPTEDVKFLGEKVKQQLYYALRAINLEYLGQEYIAQSGTAKEMDRQEVKNFLFQVAQSLIEANIKPALKYITGWRYKFVTADTWKEYVPQVTLPKEFDILSATALRQRVEALKNGGFNPSIIAEAEKQYFAKEYGKDSLEYIVLANSVDLDPLQGKTSEEKTQLLLSGAIDRLTLIASARIRDFVKDALEANENFNSLSRGQRKETVLELAKRELERQNLNLLPDIEE